MRTGPLHVHSGYGTLPMHFAKPSQRQVHMRNTANRGKCGSVRIFLPCGTVQRNLSLLHFSVRLWSRTLQIMHNIRTFLMPPRGMSMCEDMEQQE